MLGVRLSVGDFGIDRAAAVHITRKVAYVDDSICDTWVAWSPAPTDVAVLLPHDIRAANCDILVYYMPESGVTRL
jgi:hypothetical protein